MPQTLHLTVLTPGSVQVAVLVPSTSFQKCCCVAPHSAQTWLSSVSPAAYVQL